MTNTSSDIKTIYESLGKIYSQMHAIQRRNMDVYHLKLDTSAPKDFPSIVPATAKRIIRQGVSQLITDTPVIEVNCGTTINEQKIAGKLTELCYVLLEQWDNQNGIPPAQELGFNLCLHGMAVKNNIYNPEYEGLESLQINIPSPINFYPDPAGRFDLIVYNLYVGEIKEMISRWKEAYPNGGFKDIPFTKSDTDTCTWVEYISAEKRGWCAIEGADAYEPSEMKTNILGLKPTYYRYSGWGITSPDGLPEEKSIGLYDGVISSLEAEARGKTAIDNHLRLNVYGRYLFNKSTGMTQEQVNQALLPGGAALVDNPRDAVVPIPEVNINRDEWAYLAQLQDDIEGMTFNRAIQGNGAVEESGLKTMTRIRQSSLVFRPVRRSLELVMGKALYDAVLILKNDLVMGKTVKYSGKDSLDPKDIPEKFQIKVNYESVNPEEDIERNEMGLKMLNNKALSLRTVLKDYFRVENPDEELSQMIAETTILQDPNTRMALAAKILEAMGWTDAIQALEQTKTQMRPEARNKELLGSEQRLNEGNQNRPVSTHAGGDYV